MALVAYDFIIKYRAENKPYKYAVKVTLRRRGFAKRKYYTTTVLKDFRNTGPLI